MFQTHSTSVSIIICTVGRLQGLKVLLEAINSQLDVAIEELEVLVIDNSLNLGNPMENNSSSKTATFINQIKNDFRFTLHCHVEPVKGLSRARNCGILIAKGDILLFTDDDCIPAANWIGKILNSYKTNKWDGFGGRVLAIEPQIGIPSWINANRDIFWGPLCNYDLGSDTKKYCSNMYPFVGANMAVKSDTFKKIGLFRIDLGHGTGSVGEDTEFFTRMRQAKLTIWYGGDALMYHHIHPHILSFRYFFRWYCSKILFLLKTTERRSYLKEILKIICQSCIKLTKALGRWVILKCKP